MNAPATRILVFAEHEFQFLTARRTSEEARAFAEGVTAGASLYGAGSWSAYVWPADEQEMRGNEPAEEVARALDRLMRRRDRFTWERRGVSRAGEAHLAFILPGRPSGLCATQERIARSVPVMGYYYAARQELAHEDMIVDFLRRQPRGQEWVNVEALEREEVIPDGTTADYVGALCRLVDSGRVLRAWNEPVQSGS